MRDALRVNTKVKLVTGTYILQSNRSTFNQNELSPLCLLCREDDETIEHFLLHCPVLDSARRVLLNDLVSIYENLYHEQPDASRLLQFILDCGLEYQIYSGRRCASAGRTYIQEQEQDGVSSSYGRRAMAIFMLKICEHTFFVVPTDNCRRMTVRSIPLSKSIHKYKKSTKVLSV